MGSSNHLGARLLWRTAEVSIAENPQASTPAPFSACTCWPLMHVTICVYMACVSHSDLVECVAVK